MCKHSVGKCIHLFLYPKQVLPCWTRLKIPDQLLKSICCCPGIWCLMAAAILLLNTSFTQAADNYWNVASGDWSDTNPSPWTLHIEPTNSDNAYIQNSGTATVTQAGEACQNLYLGSIGSGTLVMSSGSLTVSSYLYLGSDLGSSGTYILSGISQLSANIENIGNSGTGTFNQIGGTNLISSNLTLGFNYGPAVYSLSGNGYVSAGSEIIGDHGTAVFTQTDSTNTVNYIEIGPKGTYTISGGTLNINGGFNINNYGIWDLSNSSTIINASSSIVSLIGNISNTGNASLNLDSRSLLIVPSGYDPALHFKHYSNTGFLHQVGSPLEISPADIIYGAGYISDHVDCQGLLSAPTGYSITLQGGVNISSKGNLNLGYGNLLVNDTISGMSGGTLNAYGQYITGIFTQTGGINTISWSLNLGNRADSNGTYNLSDTAQLSAGYENIGYSSTGIFVQTGGVNTISSRLCLGYFSGSTGIYNLSGTGQLSAYEEDIAGVSCTGTFTQTGGTNLISSVLYLTLNYGSKGTYNLNGGTLILKSLEKGLGNAIFNFGGGMFQASGNFSASLPMTLSGDGGNANIDTAGYPVALSGRCLVRAG